MHVRYLGHAALAIDVAGKRILCDPWWNGPAYTGQWHQYPLPCVELSDSEADFVYISHGHEDHLHVPTLRTLSRRAALVIPRCRDTGMRDFLGSLGFARVLEIGHGQTRSLAPGLRATMYINKEDSILAVTGDGRTLVNANDALHASSRHVIDHFCDMIRARHPRIDHLFLGFSGASWFPNCMLVSDDDGYDPLAREQVFLDNFAYAARRLRPRMALPFAAAFVLLDDNLRWVQEVRFRAPSPCEVLRRHGAEDIRTHFLQPGDRLVGDQVLAGGAGGRPDAESAARDIRRHFALEIAARRQRLEPDAERLARLVRALRDNALRRRGRLLDPGQRILCRIDVRDVPGTSILVDCDRLETRVERCDVLRLAPLVLSARLEILEAWVTQDYGFESISIGYGAMLQARRRDLALRNTLLGLLGRKPLPPNRAERLLQTLRAPLRALDVAWRDLHWRRLALQMRRGQVQRVNDIYASDPERWSPLPGTPEESRSA